MTKVVKNLFDISHQNIENNEQIAKDEIDHQAEEIQRRITSRKRKFKSNRNSRTSRGSVRMWKSHEKQRKSEKSFRNSKGSIKRISSIGSPEEQTDYKEMFLERRKHLRLRSSNLSLTSNPKKQVEDIMETKKQYKSFDQNIPELENDDDYEDIPDNEEALSFISQNNEICDELDSNSTSVRQKIKELNEFYTNKILGIKEFNPENSLLL